MNRLLPSATAVVWCCLSIGGVARAQSTPADLFHNDEILHFQLSGNIRALLADRGDVVQYHPVVLSYRKADSIEVQVPLNAKTRGHFRRDKSNCNYPPILLNFGQAAGPASLFSGQHKLKLVMPCQGEEYVVREYLVYKLYNLLTPKSFRARLARVQLYDTEKRKTTALYGILLEEDEQMGRRNGSAVLQKKMVRGEHTETETFLKMAVFQYMIGNTDWSVEYLHNTRIVAFDSLSLPYVVPYDFDHAGIVNAPYAAPPEALELASTRERRYRGYCIRNMQLFSEVLATFNRLKKDFYQVYTGCPLLDAKYVTATTRFLDQFYDTINDPRKLQAAFSYPCSNPPVIIRGLARN